MARIFYLEDSKVVRESFVDAMEMSGHSVTAAADLDSARAAYVPGQFDIVVTDFDLGNNQTGIDFVKERRANGDAIPVVVYSYTETSAMREDYPDMDALQLEIVHKADGPTKLREAMTRALTRVAPGNVGQQPGETRNY